MIDDFLFSSAGGRWPNWRLSFFHGESNFERNGTARNKRPSHPPNGRNETAQDDIDRLRFLLIIVFGARLCVIGLPWRPLCLAN